VQCPEGRLAVDTTRITNANIDSIATDNVADSIGRP
jgi:hypothetical protein